MSAGLFGREDVLAVVGAALAEAGARVQLVGPPGIGKSAVARAVIEGSAALWVGLGVDGVLLDVARALGVPADPGAVRGALAERGRLVLDGAEAHVDGVVAFLDVVGPCEVLITSRQRIPGVRLVELGPLAEDAGIALFLERAARVGAVADDREAVRELVRRLEGWPLALELAASRTRLYAPRELLAEPPLEVLTVAGRAEASLSRALDASWDLLDPGDRTALARVSLFRAPFDREAFRGVSGADLGALERLMDASLVRWSAVDGGRRYHLLAPIRDYASQRLTELDPARARYAEAVLGRAERAAADSETARAAGARQELGRMASDLQALVRAGGAAGARAACALGVLARAWGPLRQAEDALAAVDRADLPPALARAVGVLQADLAVRGYAGDRALAALAGLSEDATTLRLRGLAALRTGQMAAACEVLEQAVRAADVARDPREAAETRYALGVARMQHGAKAACREALREALDRVAGLDAPDLDGLIRKFLVLVERDLGIGWDTRRSLARTAVDRHVQTGNLRLEVMARNVDALVALDAGDPDADAMLDALEVQARRAGVSTSADNSRIHRAMLALERGEVEGAAAALEPLSRPEVAAFNRSWATALWGMLDLVRGQREEASARVHTAMRELEQQGLRADVNMLHNVLALLGEGDPPDLVEALPPEAPVRVAREVAMLTAAGEPLPPGLEALARRSQEARLVLALALAGVGAEVSESGAWFQSRGGERVDLTRRRVLRRVLGVLAAQHGRPIAHETLLTLGWPGEQTTGSSGRARVHVAISDLRRLGLRDDLQTVERDGGAAYRLRARVVSDLLAEGPGAPDGA